MENICIPESYEANGEKKVNWNIIGVTWVAKNGKRYLKLSHIPGTLIHVFEQKQKDVDGNEDIKF